MTWWDEPPPSDDALPLAWVFVLLALLLYLVGQTYCG